MIAQALLAVGIVALLAGIGRGRPFLLAIGILSCFGAYLAALTAGDPLAAHVAALVAQIGGTR